MKMDHLYLKKIEEKITISNPPTSPFRKGVVKVVRTLEKVDNSFPSFLKRGEGRLLKIIYLFLIIFLLLPFTGCKKEQSPAKKPMAEQVKPEAAKEAPKETEEAKKVEQEEYKYDSKGRRDPFLSLVVITKEKPTKKKGASPIESYEVDEIKLMAIAWDKNRYYALIRLPDGKTYTITQGMALGLQNGKVERITRDSVVIREYVMGYRGDMKPRDSILKLHKGEGE